VADEPQVIDELRHAMIVVRFLRTLFPPWAKDGACYRKPTRDWFTDEVADKGEATEFPETVYDAMRICAGCTLRRECVTWAYEMEADPYDPWAEATDTTDRFGVFATPGRIRERFAAFPDRVDRSLEWFDTMASSDERRWFPPRRAKEESA
jgi:hypothetical protein